MKWPWQRKHKHKYFFVGRGFGTYYVFECSTCGLRTIIFRKNFWYGSKRIGAQLLWNNFGA